MTGDRTGSILRPGKTCLSPALAKTSHPFLWGWHVEPVQAYDSRLKRLGIADLLLIYNLLLVLQYLLRIVDSCLGICCCFHLHITHITDGNWH